MITIPILALTLQFLSRIICIMHIPKNILLLFMLMKRTLWQAYTKYSVCSHCPLHFLVSLKLEEVKHLFLTMRRNIDLHCFQFKAKKIHLKNFSPLSYLPWDGGTKQPEYSRWCDEPGLLSDNMGCGTLMALQEHKVQKRNKLLLHQTP